MLTLPVPKSKLLRALELSFFQWLRASGYSQLTKRESQSYLWLQLSHPCNPMKFQVMWILPVNYLLNASFFLHFRCSYSSSDLSFFSLKTTPTTSEFISLFFVCLLSKPLSSFIFSKHTSDLLFLYKIFHSELIYTLELKYYNFADEL